MRHPASKSRPGPFDRAQPGFRASLKRDAARSDHRRPPTQQVLELHLPGADRGGRGRLPVYAYRRGAPTTRFRLEADVALGTRRIDWAFEGVADATRATVRAGPAPQIPPLRLLGALKARMGPSTRGSKPSACSHSVVWHRSRRRRGYTLVNAGIDWHPLPERPELTIGLMANNLFDVVARRHASCSGLRAAGRPRYRLTERFTYDCGLRRSS